MIKLMEYAAGWAANGASSTEVAPMEGSFLTLTVTTKSQKLLRFAFAPDTPPESVDAVVMKWLEAA